MKTIKLFTLFSIAIIALFGCAGNQKEKALDNQNTNEMQNVKYEGNNVNLQNVKNDTNNINNNQTRPEVASKAADRVAALEEVERANVIVTDQNAYVAVVLRDNVKGEVTNKLENKIADEVRATDPNIRNVFVSSNPDFVNRMKDYADKLNKGEPVTGLVEEFNEMVRRAFPNAR